MEIDRKFLKVLTPALEELKAKIGADFVVFGSAPLYLYRVLEFEGPESLHDLDITAGEGFMPSPEMERVLFHDDSDQPLYKIRLGGLDVDIGPVWPGREYLYRKIFAEAVEVDGFRFASLEMVRVWKEQMVEEYSREKDKKYLEMIDDFCRNKP